MHFVDNLLDLLLAPENMMRYYHIPGINTSKVLYIIVYCIYKFFARI